MPIRQITTEFAGQVDVTPRLVRIFTDDSFATVTASNYLSGYRDQFLPTDIAAVVYANDTAQFFTITFTSTTITLTPMSGDVVLPVVDGDFAVFSGTAGAIDDRGYLPSDATKTKVVMASAAVLANHIACFSDVAGTVNDDSATAINGGNIQAGLSGTAGTLASFPSTASKGSLKVTAVANTGDTVTTISNVAMGQASVISIPDPAAATANFAVAPAALVNNNLVKASGTAGLIADVGARPVFGTSDTWAGGGTSHTFSTPGMTAGSEGALTLKGSTNSAYIVGFAPGTDTLGVTFNTDPGADTIVGYAFMTASLA